MFKKVAIGLAVTLATPIVLYLSALLIGIIYDPLGLKTDLSTDGPPVVLDLSRPTLSTTDRWRTDGLEWATADALNAQIHSVPPVEHYWYLPATVPSDSPRAISTNPLSKETWVGASLGRDDQCWAIRETVVSSKYTGPIGKGESSRVSSPCTAEHATQALGWG